MSTVKYVDKASDGVPKWKKNAKEFTVRVNFHDRRGYQSSIPKPIMEALGIPDTLTFRIRDDTNEIIELMGKAAKKRRLQPRRKRKH